MRRAGISTLQGGIVNPSAFRVPQGLEYLVHPPHLRLRHYPEFFVLMLVRVQNAAKVAVGPMNLLLTGVGGEPELFVVGHCGTHSSHRQGNGRTIAQMDNVRILADPAAGTW